MRLLDSPCEVRVVFVPVVVSASSLAFAPASGDLGPPGQVSANPGAGRSVQGRGAARSCNQRVSFRKEEREKPGINYVPRLLEILGFLQSATNVLSSWNMYLESKMFLVHLNHFGFGSRQTLATARPPSRPRSWRRSASSLQGPTWRPLAETRSDAWALRLRPRGVPSLRVCP